MLTLLAAINVFFFLFNLLPLPPFDGGHLAVIGIESAVNGVRRLAGRAPTTACAPRRSPRSPSR
jgi:membrane-associated protease RseP (regulator of RpoE activity)